MIVTFLLVLDLHIRYAFGMNSLQTLTQSHSHMSWTNKELDAFIEEYRPFVKSVEVNDGKLSIESLEGTPITAAVSEAGWEDQKGDRYPTGQALLTANSPEFVHRWHDKLFSALSAISDRDSSEGDDVNTL